MTRTKMQLVLLLLIIVTACGSASSDTVTTVPVIPVIPVIPVVPADGMSIITQPQSTRSGRPLGPAVVFQLTNAGSAAAKSGVSVTIAKASGTGTLSGTITTTTDATGRATFDNVVITGTGAHTLTATATGPLAATTAAVNIRDVPYSITADYGTQADYLDPSFNYDIPYQLFIPKGASSQTPIPILVYGHSASGYADQRSLANALTLEGMSATVTANKTTFPFFMLFSQLPNKNEDAREGWRRSIPSMVTRLTADGYNVDTTRIYFLGYSTGGIEGVNLAYKYPGYFAAIVPVDPGFTSLALTSTKNGALVGNGTGPPNYGVMDAKWFDVSAYDDGSHGGPDAMGEWARVVAAGKTSILFFRGTNPNEVVPYGVANRDIGDLTPVIAKFPQFGVTFSKTLGSNVQVQFKNINTDKYIFSLFDGLGFPPGASTGLSHAQMNFAATSYTTNLPLYTWLALQHR